MITFKRILFPVDFSARSNGAAAYVESFARRFESEVILLHVLETPSEAYGPLEAGWSDLREEQMKHYLRDDVWPIEARRMVIPGDPAQTIVKTARDEEVDLIMMPTHGYGPFRRFILGSVTAKVLHDAECPVWTATHMEEPQTLPQVDLRTILCAVDTDDKALGALLWADALADEWGAPLVVVHALPPIEGPLDTYLDDEIRVKLMQSAETRIRDLMREASVHGRLCLHAGDPAAVIREAASMHDANLIVISRSSHGLAGRLRTKSYSIVREAPCPVLSV